MGFSGIGIWQLLIILAIVILIFGTKRLPGAAKDLGSAITNFREGMKRDSGETAKIEDAKDEDAK
ncbi:MAG: twin-arginine translocase TatA/TatE family subunit [Proteobacteria bacterium]|nr:MAG: twin-arginine translocase TatA/TatE family subunit [Pseudomonadota bacterium]